MEDLLRCNRWFHFYSLYNRTTGLFFLMSSKLYDLHSLVEVKLCEGKSSLREFNEEAFLVSSSDES